MKSYARYFLITTILLSFVVGNVVLIAPRFANARTQEEIDAQVEKNIQDLKKETGTDATLSEGKGIFVPCVSFAWGIPDVGCMILAMINGLLDYAGWLILVLPNWLFTTMINFNMDFVNKFINNITAVKVAWSIGRDIANLFFIIALILSAFITIFGLESFGLNIRTLLPRLILIALLINFSLTLGTFVVSQSNALAMVFYNRILELPDIKDPAKVYGSTGDERLISALRNMMNFQKAACEIQGTCDKNETAISKAAADEKQKIEQSLDETRRTKTIQVLRSEWNGTSETDESTETMRVGSAQCPLDGGSLTAPQKTVCQKWNNSAVSAETQAGTSIYFKFGLAIMVKLILYPIAFVVFLAGALMLLARIVKLVFYLMFAPLVFFSYLLPSQYNYWGKWWGNLFKEAFFFPGFMLALMFALLVINGLQSSTNSKLDAVSSYFIGIALFAGTLVVAQTLGGYGAAAAVGIGKNIIGSAKSAAKNYAKDTGSRMGGALASKLQIAPTSKLGRIMTLPLTRGLDLAAERGQKVKDKRQEARVGRMRMAGVAYGEDVAADRYRSYNAADRKEYLEKAKDKELRATTANLSADEIRRDLATIRDPKVRERVLGSITDINKRAEIETDPAVRQTEIERERDILNNLAGTLGKNNPEVIDRERLLKERQQTGLMSQEAIAREPTKIQELETHGEQPQAARRLELLNTRIDNDVLAMTRALGSMTAEQQRSITAADMKTNEILRRAITLGARDPNLIKNLGNDQAKVNELQFIFKGAGEMGENVDLTENIDLTIRDGGNNPVVSNDAIRNTVEGILGDISRTPSQKTDDIREYLQSYYRAADIPELRQYRGGAREADALRNYAEERAKYIKQVVERGETNMDDLTRKLMNSRQFRGLGQTLTSHPGIAVSIANKIPLSTRSGDIAAVVAAQAAEQLTPTTLPPTQTPI